MRRKSLLQQKPEFGIFQDILKGIFLRRPNRFVVECLVGSKTTPAYLPNPGRLSELLLPGRTVYLVRNRLAPVVSTGHTAVAIKRDGVPVMLHTHHTNRVARVLIEQNKIPGLEDWDIVKPEVAYGKSRFDFLLRKRKRDFVLEVKSCTLFGKRIAMFPDAVTERGTRHLIELARLAESGIGAGVLFIVHWPFAEYFLPEYHTDLTFSRTLCELRKRLMVKAVAVRWDDSLTLGDKVRELTIPWVLAGQEAHDRGNYILVLYLSQRQVISVGDLGRGDFRKGYYLYIGSAQKNLAQRIERHRRKRKNLFWHIDYLRDRAEFVTTLPVRASVQLECEIAKAIEKISDWTIRGFGSSDCSCSTHLYGMHENPLSSPAFIELLQYFRIDRLEERLPGRARAKTANKEDRPESLSRLDRVPRL